MKKALVSQEFYLKKLKEIFDQEKSNLDARIAEVEKRLDELPTEVPAVHLNQLQDDVNRLRTGERWFNYIKWNLYEDLPIAKEVEKGERESEGTFTSWVIEVDEKST